MLTLDTLAWFASWGVPATVLMGGAKGKGQSGVSGRSFNDGHVRRNERVINIDEMDRPDRIGHLYTNVAQSMPTATKAESAFANAIRAKARKVDARRRPSPPP